jgi:hypothetical protein
MENQDIISFKCVRIQSELDRYQRSKVLPRDLIEGAFSIDDVTECMGKFSKKHQRIASKLIDAYTVNMEKHLDEIKKSLRSEYSVVIQNLESSSSDFQFPTVLRRYRSDIHPITALYYDSRELIKRFNANNPRHEWLLGLLQDREFSNRMVDALSKDIIRLERIISRYYWPMHKLSNDIPLELFHARQLTTDFKHYITMFNSILEWEPN